MIDRSKRNEKEELRERTRRRMHVNIDPENYEFIPEKKRNDYYDNNSEQLVGIYVRVSTDDVRQTTSFELQKKYYEDFVIKHPKWKLVKIYADEGISGTSVKHRDAFLAMIADAKAGKLSLIICKNVSRFARNVKDFLEVIRDLAELKNPVGVFFESEAIFSLNEDSQLALTFQSTMAEEESHTRSRSMETSLRMRLDNGIPLTPKLLGYTHDAEGRLIPNPQEAPTVKLAFFMYLYGYSTQQIADTFIALERRSYLGNIKWTAQAIVQILRNERHCGDVLTRKTFTLSYRTHKTAKNNGDRPQSRYKNHHEAIVTRDDFIATQRLLDNAKYGNKSVLPELRVIEDGILKGFVSVNPKWAGFKEIDYLQASQSVYDKYPSASEQQELEITVEAGAFDLRGFQITRSEFFESVKQPYAIFDNKKIRFSTSCVRKFGSNTSIELLINPVSRQFAIRPAVTQGRNSVVFSKLSDGKYIPKEVSAAAFNDTLFALFDWNTDHKYRILGSPYEENGTIAYIFDAANSEAFLKPYVIYSSASIENGQSKIRPMQSSGKRVRAIPEAWTHSFGNAFYTQERSLQELEGQNEHDWKLRLEGELYQTGTQLNVTSFDELRDYIQKELSGITLQEVINE